MAVLFGDFILVNEIGGVQCGPEELMYTGTWWD